MIRIAQLGAGAGRGGAVGGVADDMGRGDVVRRAWVSPRPSALSGGSWSTALVPLAVLLLATAVAALAVRGWPLRMLAVLAAVTSAGMAYLAISLWVIRDVAVRASDLAEVPVADLVGTQRHYGGAVITVVAAVVTLACAVLLLRSATTERSSAARYARRTAAQTDEPDDAMSERMLWDALDEGVDPTQTEPILTTRAGDGPMVWRRLPFVEDLIGIIREESTPMSSATVLDTIIEGVRADVAAREAVFRSPRSRKRPRPRALRWM